MANKKYSLENQRVLDEILLDEIGITRGIVFGLACYKIDGQVFATLYEQGVGIKLPANRAEELKAMPHISEFRPYNKRRGKHFVQINRDTAIEFQQDRDLLLESAVYVASRSK